MSYQAADGHWTRVGSTNLNLASWLGNCGLDAVIEDESFAREMETMYLEDLTNATEVVLDNKRRPCAPGEPHHPKHDQSATKATHLRASRYHHPR